MGEVKDKLLRICEFLSIINKKIEKCVMIKKYKDLKTYEITDDEKVIEMAVMGVL